MANQRRRSTFSLRKNLAARALAINVNPAVAGPMKLRSFQESPTRLLKKAMAMNDTPAKKTPLERIPATTANSPRREYKVAEVADSTHRKGDQDVSRGGRA